MTVSLDFFQIFFKKHVKFRLLSFLVVSCKKNPKNLGFKTPFLQPCLFLTVQNLLIAIKRITSYNR